MGAGQAQVHERSVARTLAVRAALSVPMLVASSLLVFLLVANAGDPLARLKDGEPPATPQELRAERVRLHLDKPILIRYVIWAGGVVRADLGETIDHRPVRPLLVERIGVTLRLVAAAVALAVLGTLAVGVLSALRPNRCLDNWLTTASFVVLSVPVFWLGGFLKEVLALRLKELVGHRVLYTIGEASPQLQGGLLHRWSDYFGHLVLPALTLALVLTAVWSRFLRASMIDALGKDHLRAARARGVSPMQLVLRHALRNALVPLSSVVAVDFAAVLGGTVVIETVFGWHGMGAMLLDGARTFDTNQVQAWLLASASIVIGCNLLADVVATRLDPRVGLD